MDFSFAKTAFSNTQDFLSREWLETNHLGGYASSSLLNCHTRKYHGLLVAEIEAFAEKFVLLSKCEDYVIINDISYPLCGSQFPNYFQEGSFHCFQRFDLTTHPCWTFQFNDITITKEILMPHLKNTVLIRYKTSSKQPITLQLRPMIAARNFHELTHENNCMSRILSSSKQGYQIKPYATFPNLYFQINTAFECEQNPVWYKQYEYREEQERGYPYREDFFSPGQFTIACYQHQDIIFSASLNELSDDLSLIFQNEIKRRVKLRRSYTGTPLEQQLKQSGQDFLKYFTRVQKDEIRDEKGRATGAYLSIDENTDPSLCQSITLVAGYPWFLDWGRDAMISLPDLTLSTDQAAECLAILKSFAEQEHQGIIPNFLGKTPEENAYNSADASLWFAWAVQQYYLTTKDRSSIKKRLWPTLKSIFSHYQAGTLYQIHQRENGLLYAGDPGTNVTWMDAIVNGKPATPRYGAIVELNALWYNFICFMQELATCFGEKTTAKNFATLAQKIQNAFQQVFWIKSSNYLKDYVNDDGEDLSIRPNQIIAASLPYSPLAKDMAIGVIEIVIKHLLTPYGLRTLSSEDPHYIGIYQGEQSKRDQAYHNGTVWPWLLGHFARAVNKVYADRATTQQLLQPCVDALTRHLSEAGIGCVSEIFDGDAPHHPRGCIHQAWSVAAFLQLAQSLYKH